MGLSTFTTVFNTVNTSVLNPISQIIPFVFGLSSTLKNKTDPRYYVTISATGHKMIPWSVTGTLQEKIQISVASQWKEIGIFNLLGDNEIIAIGAQRIFGSTQASTYSSRRRWAGSSPVSISMKLRLEAETDAKHDVTEACSKLQSLALPGGGTFFGNDKLFLRPPGPDPTDNTLGEVIDINIGNGWFHLKSIIVESVDVIFENRMSVGGPIGAEVIIKLSSYELLTKATLAEAYRAEAVGINENISATAVAPTTKEVLGSGAISGPAGIGSVLGPAAVKAANPKGAILSGPAGFFDVSKLLLREGK